MITLTPTLKAAQLAPDRVPSLSCVATAKRGGAHILRWSRIYPGDGEADSPHAACIANDGSLIRMRNDAGTLYRQRVTSPGLGDDFTSWTSLQTGLVAGSGVALSAIAGEVLVLYTRGTTLYYRTSADNGATWSAEGTAVAHGAAITWIAVAHRVSNGNACAFFTQGANLFRLRRTSGAWAGAATNSAYSVGSLTGVAAVHDTADYCLVLTGTTVAPSSAPRVYAAQMGDGGLPSNTFTSLTTVTEADAASTTSFATPSLVYFGPSLFWATFAHKEAETPTYNRAMMVRPQANDTFTVDWTEPYPVEPTSAYGAAITAASNVAFLTTPCGAWRATYGASNDLSTRVTRARVRIGIDSATAIIELDNADGALLDAPNAAFAGLTVGGTLELAPGYIGTAGAEYASTWRFTVDAIEHVLNDAQGRRTIVRASGPWEQLARWRAPQSWQTSSLTRGAIASRIAGRSGFPLFSGSGAEAPSADWTGSSPSFAIVQGESGASALAGLLAPVSDGLRGDTTFLTIRGLKDPRMKAVATRLAPSLWLPLDEAAGGAVIAYDWSTNANHATTVTGAIAAGSALLTGQPGASADWSPGSGARHYEVPDAPAIDPGDVFTFAAVVSLGNFNNDRCLADKGTGAFRIGITTDKKVTLQKTGTGQSAISDALAIEANVPFHVIVTKNGATHAIYFNGVAAGVTVTNQTMVTNATALRIGRGHTTADQFNHQLAHVMLWTTALSAAQAGELGRAMNPAQYAYGAAEHPIVSLRETDAALRGNWTRAQGADRYADAFDHEDLDRSGPLRRWQRQLDGTTDLKVQAYAADALRRDRWGSAFGELVAAWQAGQQLFDVVSVSHPNLAGSTRLYRVAGLALDYSRGPTGPGRYDATLTLGAV